MPTNQSGAVPIPKTGTRRVNPGEPGRNVMIELKDGFPVYDKPLALVPPPSPSAPILTEDQGTGAAPLLNNEKANYRFLLVDLLNQELAKEEKKPRKERRLKRQIINTFLELYNSGMLLPKAFEKLGPVSRPTIYRYQGSLSSGGVEGLEPKTGRKEFSKITDHEKNMLLSLLLHQNRLKKSYAIALTKEILKRKGLESPSGGRTLRRFADQFEKEHYDLWVLMREGEKAHNDKVMPYIEREWNLLEVGEGLVADGHRLNFQIIHPATGKPCRAVLILFWDWRSSYPLGWEIMIEENIQCVATALRNAILNLGKIPKWIYLDNGKAFKAKIFTEDITFEDGELPGMFARLGINYHFAQPYNAQSKPIERIFGILNDQLERLIPSYTGASIDDKPAWTKRNEKLARALHDPGAWTPTIQEANGLISFWRERYAETPTRGRDNLRPIDIFNEGKGPGVDPRQLAYLMMDGKFRTVQRNGVEFLGWHWYDEALYGLKDKVLIRYSYSDLSQIYVFYKNEFLCTARPIEPVHPMASESENPKDMEAVRERLRLKKKVKSTTKKLCLLLGSKTADQIDWDRTRDPSVKEIIQAAEAENKPEIKISPFVEGYNYGRELEWEAPERISPFLHEEKPTVTESAIERPRFRDEYERYRWVMQQQAISRDDREFIDDFRGRSLLYRNTVFNDQKILDQKVIQPPEEENPEEDRPNPIQEKSDECLKYKPPKNWSDFRGDWWERYDYHMAQDPATLTQDDLEFIEWFKEMPEYRLIYEVKPGPILSGG